MGIDASTIGWIITGVIIWIIFVSFLFGLKRGAKKSLFRFLWLAVFTVALFFLMPTITNWLSGIDISFLGLDINGKIMQVKDIGVNILKSIVDDEALNSNATLMSLAQNMPAMILNVLFFVLFFWLTKWVFWPLWAILSAKFFNKQKREKKKFIKQQRKLGKSKQEINMEMPANLKVKQPKHALLGGIIGIFVGLLITAVTFMPFVGVNSIYQYAYANIKTKEGGEERPYLSTLINEDASKYINCFEDSLGLKILTYSGAKAVSTLAFNNLAVVNVNGNNVYLNKEIETGVEVYNEVVKITEIDFDNLTKDNISTIIDAARRILALTDNSQMVNLIGDNVVPYLLDGVFDSEDFSLVDDGGRVDGLIEDTYRDYEFSVRDIKNQLNHLLNIAAELNNNNLLIEFKNNAEDMSFEKAIGIIAENVTNVNKFVNNVFDNLFEVGLIGDKYATIIDEATRAAFNVVDGLEYTEQILSNTQVRNGIKTIFTKIINFCKYYNNHKDFDFGTDTVNVLKDVGDIFNVFKNSFISEENYNTILDFAKNKAKDALRDQFEITDMDSVIDSLSSITNWNTELSWLSDMYKVGVKMYNQQVTFDDLKEEENTFLKEIGAAIDKAVGTPGVSGSKIVSNENIKVIFEFLIDMLDSEQVDDLMAIEVTEGVSVKQTILNNIWNSTTNTSNVEKWEDELGDIKDLLNIDFGEGEVSLEKVGEAADCITKSKIFTADVLNAVIFDYIDNEGLPEDVKELQAVKDLKANFKNNSSQEGFSYKTEFLNFQKIIDAFDAEYTGTEDEQQEKKLKALGKAFDEILENESLVLTEGVINGLIAHFFDDYIGDMEVDTGLKNIILEIKGESNLANIESYEAEFRDLFKLAKVVSDGSASLPDIGDVLDEIVENSSAHKASKLITNILIGEIIVYYIDKEAPATSVAANGLTTVLEGIKQNASTKTIASYGVEFEHLKNLADLVSASGLTLDDAGAVLDNICNTMGDPNKTASVLVDRTSVNNMIKVLIEKQIDNNTATLGNKSTSGTLANKLMALKNNVANITSFETEFDYLNGFIDVVNASYGNNQEKLEAIGEKFDEIKTANSKLINSGNINDIILHYFDDETFSYTTGDYATCITAIRTKVQNATSYKTMFEELETITSSINSYSTVDSSNIENAGDFLDDVAAMSQAADKTIAKEFADIFVSKIKAEYPAASTQIDEILTDNNYEEYPTGAGNTYFADLFANIKGVVDAI